MFYPQYRGTYSTQSPPGTLFIPLFPHADLPPIPWDIPDTAHRTCLQYLRTATPISMYIPPTETDITCNNNGHTLWIYDHIILKNQSFFLFERFLYVIVCICMSFGIMRLPMLDISVVLLYSNVILLFFLSFSIYLHFMNRRFS